MPNIEKLIQAVSHFIHTSKPVLLELALFGLFLMELAKWLMDMASEVLK